MNFSLAEAARITNSPEDPIDLLLWTGDNTPHVDGYDFDCESIFLDSVFRFFERFLGSEPGILFSGSNRVRVSLCSHYHNVTGVISEERESWKEAFLQDRNVASFGDKCPC